MDYFHLSSGLNKGSILKCNYLNLKSFISPFVLAAMAGEDVFIATQLSARYADERIERLHGVKGLANKMATEGLFEYIRCSHYSHLRPRYESIYLFPKLESCHSFAAEFRSGSDYAIYLIEAEPEELSKYDMSFFTRVDKMLVHSYKKEECNFSNSLQFAKLYWSGVNDENSETEYLLSRDAEIKDIVYVKK